ncbi:MAG: translation initiation factor IF-2 N-terminal domain-containing protein, partial [Muribaculaceae bacterium]|nr:translation initiation factor IF-2 N-terminal domain-containing protein [Muribaculaceae bacterium]
MAIKISKVIKDLNVGRQTIEEFLHKKGIEIDASINARIQDDVYEMLVKEFKPDMDLKSKSDKMATERQKEKAKQNAAKAESHEIKTEVPVQKPKILGKIDLEAAGKPKVASKPAPKAETPAEEPVKTDSAPAQPVVENKEPETAAPVQEVAKKEEPAPVPEVPVVETQAEETSSQPAESAEDDNVEVFKPVSQTVGGPQLKVVGKVDLTSLNQQTRPRKKTKEEKRNERIAKAQAEGAGKKKRKRIGKEKIDIETAGNQAASPSAKNRGGKDDQGGKRGKDKKGNRKPLRPEVSEEDVQRQMKETLARLTAKTSKKAAARRRERREEHREEVREEAALAAAQSKILKLTEFVTANDLAIMMNVPINKVIATCMNLGVMVSINQRLDAETINIVADEFGFKTEYTSAEVAEAISEEADDPADLVQRPPVVTVMGHVDHGKTSLLDYIRNSNVIAGEAGGITQHIGAYNVKLPNGRRITFLDTPGHEAFTAMRARGAKVTDIVIVIVAADDSVMPQTVEALNHASAAGVPIIFAINKIDKPGANPEKIKEELANMNYLVEDWGGKYQSQDISAKKGIGVEELMEKVLLEADMLDLKANPNRKATGSIIESSLDKGRGY